MNVKIAPLDQRFVVHKLRGHGAYSSLYASNSVVYCLPYCLLSIRKHDTLQNPEEASSINGYNRQVYTWVTPKGREWNGSGQLRNWKGQQLCQGLIC
ncbi:unnamed protein product [Cercopithifilaria johnstoni]|uniref:Uncharacterized protein n=1 Tax=Cercopithifilaria johnstoni TaxID=2874296 RepID=A0A8J2M138_9BILA|nr:unnamed protein product [Cercopithifilaria johnstoni]